MSNAQEILSFQEQFRSLVQRAKLNRWWRKLTGRGRRLRCLSQLRSKYTGGVRSARGIQLVPVAQIGGSEGRCADFDANFRPLHPHDQDRWVRIALAHNRGEGLPPVDLVQIEDSYFVRDGHHRVSVARTFGQQVIEANVTVWQNNHVNVTDSQGV